MGRWQAWERNKGDSVKDAEQIMMVKWSDGHCESGVAHEFWCPEHAPKLMSDVVEYRLWKI